MVTAVSAIAGRHPSHDTFNRFFSALDPAEFERAFLSWIKDISEITDGDIVSIDGKTLCGSREGDSKRAIHIGSAWSKANQLSLGQIKVDEKSNEITAILMVALSGEMYTLQQSVAYRQRCGIMLIGTGVRSHWGIENNLHWQLDVSFHEDDSRKRAGYAAQNFSMLNRIALNLLKYEQSKKRSVRGKGLMQAGIMIIC